MKKILFLYTELAGYFIACVKTLAKKENVKLKIIRWPVKAEAPFKFDFGDKIEVHNKQNYTQKELEELCFEFTPDLVYITGWMDNDYRKIAKKFRKNHIPVVMGLDNPWEGSIKQKMATWVAWYYIHPYYSHVWVAGVSQYELARRLGFSKHNIIFNYYSADIDMFYRNEEHSVDEYPKILLYVGRFLEWKGIKELYEAFSEVHNEKDSSWKLLLIGNGPLKQELKSTRNIEIREFVQPQELVKIAHNAGAFCLPSWKEHWGVVVHEFAAAGLPLMVSDEVNSGTLFVREGYNGFVFKAKRKEEIKNALKRLMDNSNEELIEMGRRSKELSKQITPKIWACNLLSILK